MKRNRRAEKYQKEQRKKKRNTIIIGVVLVVLMTLSIVGVGQNQSNNSRSNFEYNGFDFKAQPDDNGNLIFFASKDGEVIGYFYTQPIDTEKYNVTPEFRQDFLTAQSIIFTRKPLGSNAEFQRDRLYQDILISHVRDILGKNVIIGTLQKDIFEESEQYTCEDASLETPVVILSDDISNGIGVFNEEELNCYSINAQDFDFLRMRDKLLYIYNGVQ